LILSSSAAAFFVFNSCSTYIFLFQHISTCFSMPAFCSVAAIAVEFDAGPGRLPRIWQEGSHKVPGGGIPGESWSGTTKATALDPASVFATRGSGY
jgi:hypothetical protein